MDYIKIEGKSPLGGEIVVQGSKNAALPIISASVLVGGRCVLKNCPKLSDTMAAVEIIEFLGGDCSWNENVLTIDTTTLKNKTIDGNLTGRLRSSIIFAGALAGRFGCLKLAMPGGCRLGARPIDIHIDAFEKLGFDVTCNDEYLEIYGNASGCDMVFAIPSVGATQNAMLAAVFANGKTTIVNAAKEPEIVCLQRFLNSAGARISGAGSSIIHIEGTKSLKDVEFEIDCDRIAAVTYMACALSSKGSILLKGSFENQIGPIMAMLSDMGALIDREQNGIRVSYVSRLKAVVAKTGPHPGFPTDCLPIMTALAATSDGVSILTENIFENRFNHTAELAKMGANIKIAGKNCIISGVEGLRGARVDALDLRGGASVVIAALGAEGETIIESPCYIDRGYENLCGVILGFGGNIQRVRGD